MTRLKKHLSWRLCTLSSTYGKGGILSFLTFFFGAWERVNSVSEIREFLGCCALFPGEISMTQATIFLYSYWAVANLFSLFFSGQREWLTYMYSTKCTCMLYHNSKIAFIYVFAHFKCFNGSLPVWNILVAPRLTKPKEDIEKVAFKGDDVSFECAAKGYPLVVEWKVKRKNEETVEACISKFCRMILFLF